MAQTLSKAERRAIRSATRQNRKNLRNAGGKKEALVVEMYPTETKVSGVSRHDLEKQRLALQLKTETQKQPESVIDKYRSRSVEVQYPYSQKVFDSLGGALQGGINLPRPKKGINLW